MNARKLSLGIVALALTAGAGAWAIAPQLRPPNQPGDQGDNEEVITLDEAPAAVRAAAIKLVGNARAIDQVIREEEEEDIVTYEVEYHDGQVVCAAVFSGAGDVMELERAVGMDSLPTAARAALAEEFNGAEFGESYLVTKTLYEVDVILDGERFEIVVDAAGNIEDHAGDEGDEARGDDEGDEAGEHHGRRGDDDDDEGEEGEENDDD